MTKNLHLGNIDFIKGLAAVSVILLHTLPKSMLYDSFAVYHIWQAVPVFLFITFFLGFRNLENKQNVFEGYYSKNRIKKLFLKLWLPLMILALVEAVFFIAIGYNNKAVGCLLLISNGPGSYYIWCYMQIWILLPFIYFLLKKSNLLTGGGILLVISLLSDFVFEISIGKIPGFTCFRYLFLSMPAYMCLKDIKMKKVTFLIFLSIIYLFLMHYSELPKYANPVLPDGWEAQTSIGFFYTYFLFVFFFKCYDKLKTYKVTKYIRHIGTISWEIFIVQMVLLGSGIIDFVSSKLFQSVYWSVGFKVISVLCISLICAKLYRRLLEAKNSC